MILDLPVQAVFAPFLILVGLALVIYGKEILDVLSFTIGALAGGILAYMIFKGLLLPYENDIPVFIVLLISAAMIVGGGLLGKGTLAMLLALFASTVIMDVAAVFIGPDYNMLIVVIGLVLFLALVPFTQKFDVVFASFVGGVSVAMGLSAFLGGLDDPVVRIVQISIAIVLCVIGVIVQKILIKKLRASKEEITWVPSKSSGSQS